MAFQILIENKAGEGFVDYAHYVVPSSIVVEDKLNQPTTISMTLANVDDAFVQPSIEAYVRIYSTRFGRVLATGFISTEPQKAFIGLNGKTPSTSFQTFNYSINIQSDDYLLNSKSIQFFPSQVGLGNGQILSQLANRLTPGFFDCTTEAITGDLIPEFNYDPTKNWGQYAKTFADASRFRVKIQDKKLQLTELGDQPLGIIYDETLPQKTFKTAGLNTKLMNTQLVNDCIVIGAEEPGNIHEDYFVGDGFTGNFGLRHLLFEGSSSDLINEPWTEAAINKQLWTVLDPTDAFSMPGTLNVNGGPKAWGQSYILANSALEMGGKLVIEHGSVLPFDTTTALLGGLYSHTSSRMPTVNLLAYGNTLNVDWGVTGAEVTSQAVSGSFGVLNFSNCVQFSGHGLLSQELGPLATYAGVFSLSFSGYSFSGSPSLEVILQDFYTGQPLIDVTALFHLNVMGSYSYSGMFPSGLGTIIPSDNLVVTFKNPTGSNLKIGLLNVQLEYGSQSTPYVDTVQTAQYGITDVLLPYESCVVGFDLRNGPSGVIPSISGAIGVAITPVFNGALIAGVPIPDFTAVDSLGPGSLPNGFYYVVATQIIDGQESSAAQERSVDLILGNAIEFTTTPLPGCTAIRVYVSNSGPGNEFNYVDLLPTRNPQFISDFPTNVGSPPESVGWKQSINIQSVQIFSGLNSQALITLDSPCPFLNNSYVYFSDLERYTYLNGRTFLITSTTGPAGPQFTVNLGFSASAYGPMVDTGKATQLGTLFPLITKENHSYVLRTIVSCYNQSRYNTVYRTLGGTPYGGQNLTALADVTWIIDDLDLTFPWANPVETRYTKIGVTLPAFVVYAPVNNFSGNMTLSYTTAYFPPQGAMQAQPFYAWVNAAALAPLSDFPWPPLANVAKFLPLLDYELGFGIYGAKATITNGQGADTSELAFFSNNLPAVGTRIRFQSWEAQAAVARVQNSVSITAQAAIVGDNGDRLAVFTDFNPLPRTSEECELAATQAINDRINPIYDGSYSVEHTFFNFLNYDYPRSGRILTINAPERGINYQDFILSTVTITITELFEEQLMVKMDFGPSRYLQTLLQKFLPPPSGLLTATDVLNPPTPIELAQVGAFYAPDLNNLRLTAPWNASSVGFDGSNIYANVNDPSVIAVEVRRSDTGWGTNNFDLIQRFYTQTFTLPRITFEQTWYMRALKVGPHLGLQQFISGSGSFQTGQYRIIMAFITADGESYPTIEQAVTVHAPGGGGSHASIRATLESIPVGVIACRFFFTAKNGAPGTESNYVDVAPALAMLIYDPPTTPGVPAKQIGISRRSKVIRVFAPLVPQDPGLDITQPVNPDPYSVPGLIKYWFSFNGDVRNVYGIEIRAYDNETILEKHTIQSPYDLIWTYDNTVALQRSVVLYIYFINTLGEYSAPFILASGIEEPLAPTILEDQKLTTHITINVNKSKWTVGPFAGQDRQDIIYTLVQYSKDPLFEE